MLKKMIYKIFGSYFFDRSGISQKNTISYSYTPELKNEKIEDSKLTSNSRLNNFLYWIYK